MDTTILRGQIYEAFQDELRNCMPSNSRKYNYFSIPDDAMSNIRKTFSSSITKDNILYVGATNWKIITLEEGKAGGVITIDGVYYLSNRYSNTIFCSHEKIYRKLILGENIFSDNWKSIISFFDQKKLLDLMNKIAVKKMVLIRTENEPLFQLKWGMASSFMSIVNIFQKYKAENDRNSFYHEIYEAFSEPVVQKKKDISDLNLVAIICRYDYLVNTYEFSLTNIIEEENYPFNRQDEVYRRILCWGVVFSLLVGLSVKEIAAEYKGTLAQIYEGIIDEKWLECISGIGMLIENFSTDVSGEALSLVKQMIENVYILICKNGYEELDEITLYVHICKILKGMQIVLLYMQRIARNLSRQINEKQKSLELCTDWLLNYPNNFVPIKGKHNKKLLENIIKSQQILDEGNYPSLLQIHTVNGMEGRQFAFCQRMNASFGIIDNIRINPPLLAIIINRFFLTGISFNLLSIAWRYLPDSPESKIFDVMGDERKSAIMGTDKITRISYFEDIPFTMIKIDEKNNEVILPITLLEEREAERVCKAIIEIYKSRGLFIPKPRKMKLTEDKREKINKICEEHSMRTYTGRYEKNDKQEITSFSSDSE